MYEKLVFMGDQVIFSVYDVDFNSVKDFFCALGYTAVQSKTKVMTQYGGYERLVQVRLNSTDIEDIKRKLNKLKSDYYLVKANNPVEDNKGYKRINKLALDCYMSAWNILDDSQKTTILKTVASINNVSIDEVQQHL